MSTQNNVKSDDGKFAFEKYTQQTEPELKVKNPVIDQAVYWSGVEPFRKNSIVFQLKSIWPAKNNHFSHTFKHSRLIRMNGIRARILSGGPKSNLIDWVHGQVTDVRTACTMSACYEMPGASMHLLKNELNGLLWISKLSEPSVRRELCLLLCSWF